MAPDSNCVDVLQQSLHNPPPLPKCCLRPFFLGLFSFGYRPIDSIGSRRVHEAEEASIGWAIALYSARARYL